MSSRVTTIDQLVAAVQHSFVSANELIAGDPEQKANQDPADSFTINNEAGRPPVEIPLSKFRVPLRHYLRKLKFELPCYTLSGPRFLKRHLRQPVLYAFSPTRWQRLHSRCCLYRLTIEIGLDYTRSSFRAATAEEAVQQATKRPPRRTPWHFTLDETQAAQLDALPCTLAKPVYWHTALMWLWRLLSGGRGKPE